MSSIPFLADVQEALRKHGYFVSGGGGNGEEYRMAIRRIDALKEGMDDYKAGRYTPVSQESPQP